MCWLLWAFCWLLFNQGYVSKGPECSTTTNHSNNNSFSRSGSLFSNTSRSDFSPQIPGTHLTTTPQDILSPAEPNTPSPMAIDDASVHAFAAVPPGVPASGNPFVAAAMAAQAQLDQYVQSTQQMITAAFALPAFASVAQRVGSYPMIPTMIPTMLTPQQGTNASLIANTRIITTNLYQTQMAIERASGSIDERAHGANTIAYFNSVRKARKLRKETRTMTTMTTMTITITITMTMTTTTRTRMQLQLQWRRSRHL